MRISSGQLPVSSLAGGVARRRALPPVRAAAFAAALLARYSGVMRHEPAPALIYRRLLLARPRAAAPLRPALYLSQTVIRLYPHHSPVAALARASETPRPFVLWERAAQPPRPGPAAAPAGSPVAWLRDQRSGVGAAQPDRLTRRLAERARRVASVQASGPFAVREEAGERATLLPVGSGRGNNRPPRPLAEGWGERAPLAAPLPGVLHRPAPAAVQPDAEPFRPPGSPWLEPESPAKPAGRPPSPGGAAPAVPPIDLNQLTDQVVRTIDQRMIAYRERTGRI